MGGLTSETDTTTLDITRFNRSIYANPFTGYLYANGFNGSCLYISEIYGTGSKREITLNPTGGLLNIGCNGSNVETCIEGNFEVGTKDSTYYYSTFNGNVEIIGNSATNADTSNSFSGLKVNGTVEATEFNATSDKRLKENITPYKCKKSILDLPVYEFDYKNSNLHTIGCLAQDLQEICPEIVVENSDGYLSIKESKLIYLLIEEVKKLRAEIRGE